MNEPKKKINYIAIIMAILAFFSVPVVDRCFQKKDKNDANTLQVAENIHNGPNYFFPKPADTMIRARDSSAAIIPKPTIVPDQKTAEEIYPDQHKPKITDPSSDKNRTRKLFLDFIITQNGTNIKYRGHGEMDIKGDGSILGGIDYKVEYVPYQYRNESSLQGNPTATEMVSGALDGSEYRFAGYELRNDYRKAYDTDKYVINLSPYNNTLQGSSRGNHNGSCVIEGTYIWQ